MKGFSKLSKEAKMEWITNEYLGGEELFEKQTVDFSEYQ
tara:strand:- start:286 stop:402 length:117 start_codon:yes stop_codon:yes gene_type:complete